MRTLCAEETYLGNGSGTPSTSGTRISQVYYVRKNAVVSTRGLGFLGFASSAAWDVLKGVRIQTTFDPAKFGVPTYSKTYLDEESNNPFLTVTNTWDSHSTLYGKLDPRLTQSVSVDVLSGVTTTTVNSYDPYGYLSRVRTTRSVAAAGSAVADSKGEDTYTEFSHSFSSATFILGSPSRQETTRTGRLYGTANTMNGEPATDLWSRKVEWTYDSKKRPLTKKEYGWLKTTYLNEDLLPEEISADYDTSGGSKGDVGTDGGGPLRVPKIFTGGELEKETRWTYDARGNVLTEKVYPHEATSYLQTSWTYDSSGRRVVSSTDPLGLTTTYSGYDVFGNPASVTDHTGTTSYTYDTWGRLTRTDHPSKEWEDELRAWGGKGLYTVLSRTSHGTRDSTHYDAAGRVVRSADKRYNGTWRVVRRQYDTKGRLLKVSLPFKGSSTPKWNVYTYDPYGRETLYTEASGKTTTHSYNGRVSSVTSANVTTTTTVDADGNAVLIHDPGGDIVNVLQPHGKPVRTTAPGNAVTTLRYDQWGNRSRIDAPSFGTQTDTTVWNTSGTSVSTTVNRYGTTVVTRDILGRTTAVSRTGAGSGSEYGAFNTTYSYNSKGLLTSESSTNGTSHSYTYDTFDRLKTVTETAAGLSFSSTAVYSDTTSLGPIGTVRSVTFKRGNTTLAKEIYTYAYGHRKKIAVNSSTGITNGTKVWELTGENELGLPTSSGTLSITRSSGYDTLGVPTSRTTNSVTEGYAISVQTGNLTSRTPPAPSGGTAPGTESFGYDGINRITSWTRPGSATTATTSYDTKGNITTLSTSGTMAYAGGATDPYSLTGYTPASSSSARTLPTVLYNPMGRPSRVTTSDDYRVDFVYDADGPRKKMTVTDDSSTTPTVLFNRIYLGGRFERETNGSGTVTAERLWLGGDAYSAPVVLKRSGSSGNWTAYNVGRDLLGSITSVQTKAGTVSEQRSYDPWGRARDPQTLAPIPSGSEPTYMLGRGFTGHEWIPYARVWNANARLYDPILGRFLSPDPYVQAPGFTQNYNRFAYALNNPLVYSDESGEFAITTMLIVGGITAALFGGGNLAAHAIRKDDLGHGNWAKYFFSGAVAGFIVGVSAYSGFAGLQGLSNMSGFLGTFGTIGKFGALGGETMHITATTIGMGGGLIRHGWEGLANSAKIFLGNFYLDENASFFGSVWQGVSRHTWESLQTGLGYDYTQFRNGLADINRVKFYKGATFVINEESRKHQGATIGSYINIDDSSKIPNNIGFENYVNEEDQLYAHEYGHVIQSRRLGLSYPIIAIFSLGSQIADDLNTGHHHSLFFTEVMANRFSCPLFPSYSWGTPEYPIKY